MSETVLPTKQEAELTVDGRVIVVKELNFIERHRALRVLGPAAASSAAYLADCLMFASVRSIDGVPVPPIDPKRDVESTILALGDDGCEAVQTWFAERMEASPADVVEAAKN